MSNSSRNILRSLPAGTPLTAFAVPPMTESTVPATQIAKAPSLSDFPNLCDGATHTLLEDPIMLPSGHCFSRATFNQLPSRTILGQSTRRDPVTGSLFLDSEVKAAPAPVSQL